MLKVFFNNSIFISPSYEYYLYCTQCALNKFPRYLEYPDKVLNPQFKDKLQRSKAGIIKTKSWLLFNN